MMHPYSVERTKIVNEEVPSPIWFHQKDRLPKLSHKVVVVSKKNAKSSVCIDFGYLNNLAKDSFSLPKIDQLADETL